MAINRVLYATQTARLFTGTKWYALPAQSASADETIPQDDVLVLGKLGGVARLQKDVATAKASLKVFLCDTIQIDKTNYSSFDATAAENEANLKEGEIVNIPTMLSALETDSIAGANVTVNVDSTGLNTVSASDGFSFVGIATSIGIDASKGAFPMIDLGFEGIGRLNTLAMGVSSTLADTVGGDWYVTAATPLTSRNVSIDSASTDTVASVKSSYDMPTETLSRLGGLIVGSQSVVAADNQMFSKPPFKASMTADGQNLALVATQWAGTGAKIVFDGNAGDLKVEIGSTGLNVSTKSFSQNVGDIGATFSVTAEGTKMTFLA